VRGFAGRDGIAVLAADQVLTLFGSAQPPLMRDGIHPTDEGHTVLALVVRDGHWRGRVGDGCAGDGGEEGTVSELTSRWPPCPYHRRR
jgi:hypothetical protein